MPVDPVALATAVAEIIDRHGVRALSVADERVQSATRAGDLPALDLALLMLSEVERRVQAEGSAAIR